MICTINTDNKRVLFHCFILVCRNCSSFVHHLYLTLNFRRHLYMKAKFYFAKINLKIHFKIDRKIAGVFLHERVRDVRASTR